MGHRIDAYDRLQQRLDRTVTGAPDSPLLMRILRLLFTPEQAALAAKFPTRPTAVDLLAPRLGVEVARLDDQVSEMARRGLVIDLVRDGRRHVSLAPVVIGFFEFTFMRARDDLPLTELAELFDRYMTDDDRFGRSVFAGKTQLGRSLVREEALPADDHVEVLDWERASELIRSAGAVAVSLCACRHKASHQGKACASPLEVCLSLNTGAEVMVRNGLARALTAAEGLEILEQCKLSGLAQTGDNVQRGVSYICNCCGCCCGMMQAIRRLGIRGAVVTSNWIAELDAGRCKGCGQCVESCPSGAIRMERFRHNGRLRMRAEADPELCLGCGVCHAACRNGAVTIRPRPRRVYTPESLFDRYAAMAIERGKLADLIFEDAEGLGYRALGRIVAALERAAPFKAAMAIEPLRSVFLRGIVAGARRSSPEL